MSESPWANAPHLLAAIVSPRWRAVRNLVASLVAFALVATLVGVPLEADQASAVASRAGTPTTVSETSYEPNGFGSTAYLHDGSTVASITTANSHTGNWSYALESQVTGYWVGMSETLTGLTIGRSYTLSAWVDASGTSGLTDIGIGADGLGSTLATTSGWQELDFTFTAVSTTQDWAFGHGDASPTSGAVYWDDLQLTQDGYLDGSGWHSPEVLHSQGYEMGGFATEAYLNDGSTIASLTTANSRTGDWSFGLRSQLTGYWVGMSDTLTGLVDGHEYTLRAWVNISGTTGLSDISLDVHGIGKDSATVGGWQELSYTFTADGTTQDWSLGHNDASPTSGTVYWDDVSLESAADESAPTWPAVEVTADPSYMSSKGITLLNEEPLLQLVAYDDDAEDPLPDMDFEVRIEDESEQLVISDLIAGTHVYGLQYVDWSLPTATLSEGETYSLLIRLHSATEDGPWSEGTRLHVGSPIDQPTLIAPIDNAVVLPGVALQADVGDEEGADVAFRVEASWGFGFPVEVASGTAQTDVDGIATFSPELTLNPYQEVDLRWQALVQGDGYSEWSDFAEFSVSSLPPAVSSLNAIQNRNSIHVTWGSGGYFLDDAPITGYTVTLSPDDVTIEVPDYPRLADFTGLAIGEYEVSVTPHNALGDGPMTTVPVEIGTYSPSEPLNVQASAVLTDATVTWDPPADLGGGVLDHYNVDLYTPFCEDSQSFTTVDDHIDLTGLEEGCLYYVNVSAETADGAGSTGFAEFYAYGLPGAPTDPELRAGDGWVDVYWTAAYDNGSPITSYTVTTNPGAIELTVPVSGTWPRVAARVEGLTNLSTYTFSITATNAAGEGVSLSAGSIAPDENISDQDLDGLVDAAEAIVGTNPLLADTDGDGLNDFAEVRYLSGATDPLVADTDDDAVDDGAADADSDGISNLDEIGAGTDPLKGDTDGDGLSDSDEALYGTDPLVLDTDEDSLSDGYEFANGTDPTNADSDNDSESDAEEVVDRDVLSNPDYAPDGVSPATAALTGPEGSLAGVSVEQGSVVDFPGAVTFSAMVNEAPAPDESGFARGTFGLDPPTVRSLKIHYATPVSLVTNLRPIKWNTTLQRWEFVSNDVSVSTAENTITIDSPDLGVRYAVVNLDEWRNNANQCYLAEIGKPRLDVEVILDATSSMEYNDPTGERFDAMRTVIGALRPGDRVSVRQFGIVGVGARGGAGGSGNFYLPDTWLESWWTSPNGVTLTPAEALALVDLMEVNAATDSTIDEWDSSLISWGLIEQAIGGIRGQGEWLRGGEFQTDPAACRLHTLLLVTDGSAKPTGLPSGMNVPGYVDFRDRTDPVHVLDVGVGSPTTALWLEQLASDTGGTYSYVPTETDLNSWIEDVLPYNWSLPISDTLDSDNDGVPDKIEIKGVVDTASRKDAGMPARYTSDPYNADTDDDGMPDGMEIGSRASSSQLGLPSSTGSVAFYVNSDPSSVDGDGDYVPDLDEVETGGRPLIADIDNDGADDGTELAWGTDPNKADTDGDGKLDGEEINNRFSGDDPLEVPVVTTPADLVRELYVGFYLGEIMYIPDSIPWLIGNIASGFIPVAGVIADLRDAVGQLARVEVLGAILSLIGAIPILGDGIRAVAVLAKAAVRATKSYFRAFVVSLADREGILDDVVERAIGDIDLNLQLKLDYLDVDNAARNFALEFMSPAQLKLLVDYPYISTAYRPMGLATPVIRTNDWRLTGKLGGEHFLDQMGYPGYKEVINDPGSGIVRKYDLVINGLYPQYREFKTGFVRWSNVKDEVAKDAAWVASGHTVIWSLLASGATGIGADARTLRELEDAGIILEIHWPDEGF